MGAWGTSLYANDTACDIRGDYIEKLRFGKSNEEATNELIAANQDLVGDVEEEPLFWYALADVQWNYGRLLPTVKDKALFFLTQKEELERWKDSGEDKLRAWEDTLRKLGEKLNSPQPPEKKVYRFRIYHCKWTLGDVFAYRFSSEYSKEKGFYGQYAVFRKVSEAIYYPKHIIPLVQIYFWIGDHVPDLTEVSRMAKLPDLSQTYYKNSKKPLCYNIKLVTESERAIPKENLTYIGNLQGDDLIPFQGKSYLSCYSAGWEKSKLNNKIEHHIIDQYLNWRQ